MSVEWGLLLDAFHLENHTLLRSYTITNLWGFIGYGIVFYNVIARQRGILPFWMHAFYLAHGSSIAARALLAAPDHDNHFFLIGTGVAMAVWNLQDIYVMWSALAGHAVIQPKLGECCVNSRQSLGFSTKNTATMFGVLAPTISAALASAARQVAFWYVTFKLGFEFLSGNPRGAPMFSCGIFTNIVLNAGVSEHWRTRKTREDCGGLLFVLAQFCSAANSFYPYNMWKLISPDLYDSFWHHACGVVTLGITLINFAYVYSLPNETSKKRKTI